MVFKNYQASCIWRHILNVSLRKHSLMTSDEKVIQRLQELIDRGREIERSKKPPPRNSIGFDSSTSKGVRHINVSYDLFLIVFSLVIEPQASSN